MNEDQLLMVYLKHIYFTVYTNISLYLLLIALQLKTKLRASFDHLHVYFIRIFRCNIMQI